MVSSQGFYYKSQNRGNWIATTNSEVGKHISISGDGQYCLIMPKSANYTYQAKLSSDRMNTFSNISPSIYYGVGSCMSENGQYMYIATGNSIIISSNYGVTWAYKYFGVYSIANTQIKCSRDGKHVVTTSGNKVLVSHDSGNTFQEVHTDSTTNGYLSVDISDDGQVIAAVGKYVSSMAISVNGGTSFLNKFQGIQLRSVAVYGDSSLIIVHEWSVSGSKMHLSSDKGESWTITMLSDLGIFEDISLIEIN